MSIRHARCHCGLTVIANDERKTISHEAPECDWFRALVMAHATPSVTTEIEILDVDTGQPAPGTSKGGDA